MYGVDSLLIAISTDYHFINVLRKRLLFKYPELKDQFEFTPLSISYSGNIVYRPINDGPGLDLNQLRFDIFVVLHELHIYHNNHHYILTITPDRELENAFSFKRIAYRYKSPYKEVANTLISPMNQTQSLKLYILTKYNNFIKRST